MNPSIKKVQNSTVHKDKNLIKGSRFSVNKYLSFVKPAHYEEDVGAEALCDALMTEEASQAVYQEVAREELSNSHQLQQELQS